MSPAQIFNPRLVVGLIGAAIVAFAALLLLLAYGGGGGGARQSDGRGHALSTAATGFKGLVSLVGAFHETRLVRSADDQSENLLVVSMEMTSQPGALQSLLQRRQGRATLIILPKWMTVADPTRRGWVRALGPGTGGSVGDAFGKSARVSLVPGRTLTRMSGADILAGLSGPVPRAPQVIQGDELVPLLSLAGDGALLARLGDQPHYVLADPDLMNNAGLHDPATARFALRLIDALNATGASGVDFDLTMNGVGGDASPSLLRLAFEPPFLAMTLALFFAALAAGFYGAFRFGPVRRDERAIALGKTALVENSAGLIRLARREARLGGAYAEVVRGEAARITGAPAWLGGDKLDAYLDRIGKAGAPPFTALSDAVTRAADRAGLIAAARALHLWKKDLVK